VVRVVTLKPHGLPQPQPAWAATTLVAVAARVKADILPLVLVAQVVVERAALALSAPQEPQTPEAVVVVAAILGPHLPEATAQAALLSFVMPVRRQELLAAP